MTLNEAIKHAEKVAEQNEWFDKNCLESMQCRECAEEHRQLAEWLKDYKRLLEQDLCDDAIRRKAVDKLSKELVHITRDKADFLCNFWEGLQKLPLITPQQKPRQNFINWISIDEEPPKGHQQVWIWYKHCEKYKYIDFDRRDDHYTETSYETAKIDTYIIGEFGETFWLNLPKDESYIGYHGEKHIITNTVLAWCPMEPYQHK